MRNPLIPYALICLGLPLAAQTAPEPPPQEPVYFTEPEQPWWIPKGHLILTAERIPAVGDPMAPGVDRLRAHLELGWKTTWGVAVGEVAFRAGLGSDGNTFNSSRYDQEPSNGVWLKRASVAFPVARERVFGELTLGLQSNPLLSQESLWDHDLALVGAGLRAAFRREEAGIQEAGIRAVKGRVRTFPDADVDLTAVQGVVRFEVGNWIWTGHAGRWELAWEAGAHRNRSALRSNGAGLQRMRLDAVGMGLQATGSWPWELKAIQHRNPATGESGKEAQVWLGSRARVWRPQTGYIWQQYAFTGTLMPVNGDEWWFTRAAWGPRYMLVLPLPHRCRLTLSHMKQRWDGAEGTVERTALTLLWQF